ncbi:MAG: hypothetical protein WCF23_12385 [Candidatus Nitrosopolaris sp.]
MDEQQPPDKRNEKNNDRDSSNTEFSFKYTELGGISNRFLIVSYNSKTNIITSSTDVSGSNIMQKQPSESDEQELIEVVRTNEFFNTKTDYPPEKDDENLVTHTLTITVGDSIHTTGWTAASKDIPERIMKIVNRIKKTVSKEKIV